MKADRRKHQQESLTEIYVVIMISCHDRAQEQGYPLLKTPLGELASGLAMGLNITLLGVYINIYNAPTNYPFITATNQVSLR